MTCILKIKYQKIHIVIDSKPQKNNYDIELPQSIVESFARFLVTEIQRYYLD